MIQYFYSGFYAHHPEQCFNGIWGNEEQFTAKDTLKEIKEYYYNMHFGAVQITAFNIIGTE